MIIGKLTCSACGKDCTPPRHLWGFKMWIQGSVHPGQQQDLEEVEKEFGQKEFIFCWACTAKAFGAKPLEKEKPKKEEDKSFFHKTEESEKETTTV